MTMLHLSNLSKTYPGADDPALDGLTLTVPPGKITALLGPSGCGKTTALKIVAGLLAPSSGDVTIDDQSILALAPERRGAVMVFQNPLLFPHMTVAENIGFGLTMRSQPKAQIADHVTKMLHLIQLPDFGPRRCAQLSGGQAQRIALARALILQPKVLLLDEPLTNLDAALRAEMRSLIHDLQRRLGFTTIFVTHDQQEAVELADHIALLLKGRLQQFGPPEAFFNTPSSQTVARFFGGANFIAGTCRNGVFTSPIGTLALPAGHADGHATLTIRPESIRLGAAAENTLQAVLSSKAYLGAQTRLTFQIGGSVLTAVCHPAEAAAMTIGTTTAITLPAQAIWLLR